jgi:hypothetical protein
LNTVSSLKGSYRSNFFIPLLVDGFDAENGVRDIKSLHQMPLRDETFGADIADLLKTIQRDFQLRGW